MVTAAVIVLVELTWQVSLSEGFHKLIDGELFTLLP
jgi:hypothetical protein